MAGKATTRRAVAIAITVWYDEPYNISLGAAAILWTRLAVGTMRRANSIFSTSVASSASAFELLTRFDTGQRCRKSFATGFRIPAPASPLSHGANCASVKKAGMRSWIWAA